MLTLMIALLAAACGSQTENSNNQTGVLKKSMNVADETAAIRNLQNIFRAETQYLTIHSGYGTFDELVKDGSLDQRFAGSAPVLEGYAFTLTIKPDSSGQATDYGINADPKVEPSGGARHLYMDSSSNIIHANASQRATASDPSVSQ